MRVLVLTDDVVGPAMAGSAYRSWELASALARAGHQVSVAAAPGSHRPSEAGPNLVDRPRWTEADAVISPPWNLPARAFVPGHLLIVDGITPLIAELDAMPATPAIERRRRTAAARLPLVAARADALLTGGPAQVEWWSERIRGRFGFPFLNVPFGIPDRPPDPERGSIPAVPDTHAVVLWWGGVWPWLDLDTLLAARARLGSAPVTVVVPTAQRPDGAATGVTAEELKRKAHQHGLKPPAVVALEHWVPYHDRHIILNRASLVAVLHQSTEEAALSFRTRAMDGVWAGVPVLLSEGGEASRQTREEGWGGVVAAGDVRGVAAAMELLLGEREQARCRLAISQSRDAWTWSRVTEPLVSALDELPGVPRRALAPALVRAALALRRRARPRSTAS
jgi:glycosyltransferase involved in cell wall biosynthesis